MGNVFVVQSGYTHAPCIGSKDTKLIAQTNHLIFAQAGVAEHAYLLGDEAHVCFDASALESIDQLLAHGLDANSHLAQLPLPNRTQSRRVEHLGNDSTAVNRWIGELVRIMILSCERTR